MSNENKVISFAEVKNCAVETAIIAGLEGRAGRAVSEPFLVGIGSCAKYDTATIFDIINKMVTAGTLKKTFQTATDSKHRSYRLPMYSLVPRY